MTPEYFDIHSHINFSDYSEDQVDLLKQMKESAVWTTAVGVDLEKSKEAVELAEKNEGVFACIGVHPADDVNQSFEVSKFESLVSHPKVVAIGECGLDYFRMTGDATIEKKRQKDLFEQQINFAIEHQKLLMIHCREAYEDATDILESYSRKFGDKLWGNAHFFAGGMEIGKRLLNINFSLSFTGVITFTHDYDEVIRMTPLDMIMSETDAPYVAPVPFRGKKNSPVYVKYVAEKIAEIRGGDLETVKKTLVQNALTRFKIRA
jgi:TatD DNase family protein